MIGLLYLDAGHGSEAFAERSLGTLEALAGVAAAAIENARLHGRLLSENQRLRQQLEQGDAFSAITTVDSGMTSLLRRAMLMAQTDVSIMILGETGTGKELLARAIHQASPRAGKPFVAQNCAAMPQQLVDALIFGHERGVFTGAHCSRAGFFELANGGTLFLDEVGELDAGQQAKLLRVVEDGIVRRLGAARERRVDVRIISATSRDIHQAVRAGGFREELAYRLGVLELRIAPLRERRADIPILAQHFVQKHAPTDAHRTRTLFTREALEFLQTLHWAGNVRALENLVRRALVLCEPGPIDVLDIRSLLPELNEVQPGRSPVRAGTPRLSPGIARDPAFDLRVGEIREALQRTSGNQSRAAALLGCHRNTLRRWIQEFGIGTQK
jgi:transcriptional regulator with GAF, ATPase, and Fis domain